MSTVHQRRTAAVEAFRLDPPDDDRIWRRRTWGKGRWKARTGVLWRPIRRHLLRRGFVAGEDGRITHAPCRGCGVQFRVRELSVFRDCDDCGAGRPATICRRERAGRKVREDLRRTYTDGARRGPHADLANQELAR